MAESTDYAISYIYRILDEYSPALKKIQEQTEKMGKETEHATEKAEHGFKLFGIAVGSILTAEGLTELGKKAWEFGKDCVMAAEKSSVSLALLKNNLNNLRHAGGPTFDELEEKAKKLSKTTIFSSEQILTGSTKSLMQFGNIQGEMFDRAQKAAMDLTVAMYGVNASEENLSSASKMLGKSLESGNMRMFAKYGINLTDMEKKQVQYLKKVGDTAAVQEFVLNKLATAPAFKNAMDTMANTAVGMQKRISNSMEEMKVRVGNALLPIVTKVMEMAVKAMPMLENAVTVLTPLLNGLVGVANLLINVFTGVYDIINKNKIAFAVLGAGILAYAIVTQFAAITTTIWTTVTKIQAAATAILTAAMDSNPIGLIVLGIAALVFGITMLVTHIKKVTHFFQWLGNIIMTNVIGAFNSVKKVIFNLLDNPIIRTIATIFLPFITIPLLIAKNFGMVKQIIGEIISLFTGKVDIFKAMGDIGKIFGGKGNEVMPTNSTPTVNVNSSNTLTVFKERGTNVVPYKKSSKLGYQN